MRISGLFLHSRVARRTFRVLLAAALLPLAVFVLLATQVYLNDRADRAQRNESEYLKHIGMRTFDRLTAARATLAAKAIDAQFEAPRFHDEAVKAVLAGLASVGVDGRVHGDPVLVARWQQARGEAPRSSRDLWWLPAADDAPAHVMLTWPDAAGRGTWVAEVSPGFLWQDFSADGPASTVCLSDAQRRPLRCPHVANAGDPAWHLFLKARFGSGDWVLQGRQHEPETALQDDVLRLAATGGVATLLLIAMLGLVLVRRTMVPLEQIIAGTKRLAAGDWSTRVAEGRNDEFGQLAQLFNGMVDRHGRQMQAFEAQAGIDRELLGSLDLDRLMQQILRRLQVLAPGARLAVLARTWSGPDWRVHRPDAETGLQPVPELALRQAVADGLAVHCDARRNPPDWIRQALALPASEPAAACWVPAAWQDEPVALIVLCAARPLAMDDDARRELEALRDRCALAIAAAEREHRLVERAVRDDLTGLLNRHGLHDTCDDLLADSSAPQPFTLLFMDLDGFKEVNDAMGHTVGDILLRAVADRMRALVPEGTVLARPGGDEFVAVLPATADAEALAAALCDRLAHPFVLRGQLQHIGASIGLASCPADGTERDELLRRADLAMYAAKADGRGRWRRYAATLDQEASERAWIGRDLRTALASGQLEVHYQPRLDLRTGRTDGAEALVRWRHPERGWIPPVRFVPVAEESDLIVALGEQVMNMAMAQRRRWRDLGVPIGRVAVNVSARQLQDAGFADTVLAMLARHGLRPQELELEITESLFAGEAALVERALAPLRAAGVQVALDDFGTGFSSLSALRHLPVDVMKIDRSFVIDLGQDPDSDAVVRAVIALARDLGKRVVAEGVETELQQQRLRALGCDEVQGYRYAKPLAPEAFLEGVRAGFDAPLRAAETQTVDA